MHNVVELVGISKAFSGVPVLEQVSMAIKPGTIHALIGGNGAGKSTLVKILSGIYEPDGGDILISSQKVSFRSPSDAHSKGIYLVPQEPMLYPFMTVEENVLLTMPGGIHSYRNRLKELMVSLNCDFDATELAGDLTIAKQQQVELIRGLIRDTKVMILDEPTSALTAKEANALFQRIRMLKHDKSVAFVYITHRLNELFQIADEVTILNERRVVSTGKISDYTLKGIISIMVPTVESDTICSATGNWDNSVSGTDKKPIFEVRNLGGDGFSDVSFEVRPCEVLGITGVVGAGRTELAETLFGLRPRACGSVALRGNLVEITNPKQAIEHGIVYVPENRHLHGIFLGASIKHNVTACILDRLSRLFIHDARESAVCERCMSSFSIKATSGDQKTQQLSGGNQQKVVLGKWLSTDPKIVILDEPTRGIDARAREEVYSQIRRLATNGIGVVMISSDFEEAVSLCDRVVVMYSGRVVSVISQPNISLESVTYSAFGYTREGAQ